MEEKTKGFGPNRTAGIPQPGAVKERVDIKIIYRDVPADRIKYVDKTIINPVLEDKKIINPIIVDEIIKRQLLELVPVRKEYPVPEITLVPKEVPYDKPVPVEVPIKVAKLSYHCQRCGFKMPQEEGGK